MLMTGRRRKPGGRAVVLGWQLFRNCPALHFRLPVCSGYEL